MSKKFEGNEDWAKRGEGRMPTKGALAAERASAGLGTSSDDDDDYMFKPPAPSLDPWPKTARRTPRPAR